EGTVYRSATLPDDVIAKYTAGAVVTEYGFTSSSYDKKAAFSGKHRFVIQSRTGKKVDDLSPYPNEKEVLFKPGTQYRVLKTRKERGGQTIYLEEV
ncbi:MAG TPA: ADP-ribosyltransferase domain-containing protein, partial [Coleofasciculaceae cyanobacterium]